MARMAAKKGKSLNKNATKQSEVRFMGPEPEKMIIMSESEMARCLTWYNTYYNNFEAIDFLVQYLEAHSYAPEIIKAVREIEPWRIRFNIMTRARMIMRGVMFTKEDLDRFHAQLAAELEYVQNFMAAKKETKKVVQFPKRRDVNIDHIVDVEEAMDEFLMTGQSSFNAYTHFKIKGTSAKVVNEFAKKLEMILEELNDAEIVRSMKRAEKKAYAAFIQQILTDCQSYTNSRKAAATVVRKPRKQKVKTADQIVSKVRYCKDSTEFKVSSIDPKAILGAQELWCFDVVGRNLFVYRSIDDSGFGILGTKLTNVDLEKSGAKKLRKPLETLPKLTGTKAAWTRVYNEIKTKEGKGNARLTEKIILMKVFK